MTSANLQAMSTLAEIEAAAKSLPPNEREELAIKLTAELRSEGTFMPEPRAFSNEQIKEWMDEDARQGREIREMLGLK